ncbi:hypothetical protein GH714_024743 [Hevea brasiliensis]|uniref:Uncharacterized protein n=1 Tax=Hevea brasiliensis TaxID=3981 RepID=A0A6A6LB34_HEVBR|nr:hypothetical protein GH714_024743 [Hevea brasiliensis]
MKGGQASPMFPTNGKKCGCALKNPKPSSPILPLLMVAIALKTVVRQHELKYKQLEPSRLNDDAQNFDELDDEGDVAGPLKRHGVSHEDRPLSVGKSSAWHRFFHIKPFSILRCMELLVLSWSYYPS